MSYVLTSLSGNLISAASAAYAPTNSADVSAIASAYAESAASSKQDTLTFGYDADKISAINGSALAGGGGGATGDYLTAVIGSDRARIATAFQNGNNNRPSLLISAEREAARSTWPRMILTDWNKTTGLNHSGMLLADGFEFYQCPDSAYGQVSPSGIKRARLDPTELTFIVDTAISSDNHYAKYGRQGLWMTPTAGSADSIRISSDTSVGPFIQLNDNSGLSGSMSVSSIGYWNGKADSSALSSYALSADVSGTVDLVSTQSANWGGSALALSAGPGVKLEKVGTTLVASTDETVLFSGSNGGMVATNLTEPLSSFNSFKICFNPFGNGMSREWKEFSWAGSSDVYTVATFHKNNNDNLAWFAAFQPNTDGTTITPIANKLWILGSTTVQDRTQMSVYRVVGINRTAEA